MNPRQTFLQKVESNKPFTKTEAWGLFRMAAFGEGIGWSLLIIGITWRHYQFTGYAYVLPIAGQTHGILFLIYFGILLATFTSQRWPRHYFVIAAVAGVVPFASVVFEQFVAYAQRANLIRQLFRSIALAAISKVSSTVQ